MPLTAESQGTAPGRGRLTGRRIVVVGAGTRPSEDPDAPIGNRRGIAVLCAREGANVACVDVDKDAAKYTGDLCVREGVEATTIVADVRDAEACERLVHEARDRLGELDGVVANVGFGAGSGLADTSPELWDEIFALNVRSHFLVARAALPVFDDGSSLVFIGSAAVCVPAHAFRPMTHRRQRCSGCAATLRSRVRRAAFAPTTSYPDP
jgi:NAD(P)-dependent dehydrogenase (short-subunit alcohol dehydrogenase family)